MKNIHILPTDKPSRLYLHSENELQLRTNIIRTSEDYLGSNQHIYITSDEEIKYDDYYLGEDNNIYCLVTTFNCNGKKIILTTDQDLIKDGVQAIDDEFLEWFVKNPSCEKVEVAENTFKVDLLEYKTNYKIVRWWDDKSLNGRLYLNKDEMELLIIKMQEMMKYFLEK
jgi:hypothetical protein